MEGRRREKYWNIGKSNSVKAYFSNLFHCYRVTRLGSFNASLSPVLPTDDSSTASLPSRYQHQDKLISNRAGGRNIVLGGRLVFCCFFI